MEEKKTSVELLKSVAGVGMAWGAWQLARLLKNKLQILTGNATGNTSGDASSTVLVSSTRPTLRKRRVESSVIVTDSMLFFLEVLGINLTLGDLLHLSDIKKAFRAQALRLHPDKGGKQEEFCRVHDAAKFLIEMMDSPTHPVSDKYRNDFDKELDALLRELADLKAEAFSRRAKMSIVRAEIAQVNARCEKIEEGIIEQKVCVEKQNTFIEKQKVFVEQQNTFIEKQKVLVEKQNAFIEKQKGINEEQKGINEKQNEFNFELNTQLTLVEQKLRALELQRGIATPRSPKSRRLSLFVPADEEMPEEELPVADPRACYDSVAP